MRDRAARSRASRSHSPNRASPEIPVRSRNPTPSSLPPLFCAGGCYTNGKMSGIVRWLVAIAATASIVVVLFGAWLGWRLRQGPLPVPMLDPVVARALAGRDPDLRAEFAATILAWPEGRLPQVHVLELRLSRVDGTILAEFPELSIRPSLRALLGGRLAVGAVGVTGVKLAITRDS